MIEGFGYVLFILLIAGLLFSGVVVFGALALINWRDKRQGNRDIQLRIVLPLLGFVVALVLWVREVL